MEVLDINTLLSFKTQDTVQKLDSKTLELIKKLFGSIHKKNKKFVKKQNINILKNQKIQTKKNNTVNRVNLILNKLSETNIDNLVFEFIENINQVDKENFDEIQKTIYLKILSEINFVNIYLEFLKKIGYIYNKVQQYDLSFFFSIVEIKFKIDYTNWDKTCNKYIFIKDLNGETLRINNLILIKKLVENNLISDKIFEECDKIILEQNVFLPDIYHWFNSKNRILTELESNQIKHHIKNIGTTQREYVLLENLLNKKIINLIQLEKQQENNSEKIIKTDTLTLECENIIEEYILIKSLDDIKYFINNRCLDSISKNKFCEILIDIYFSSNKENSTEIINLIKELIEFQTLFKLNLSKGLLLINNNWKEKSIDYNNPQNKMKLLLEMFKSIGITKGIEFLMTKYKVNS
jgi:hypothetical protein